jgi:hypothetical protein
MRRNTNGAFHEKGEFGRAGVGIGRGLGLGSQKRPAVRLLTVGLYYINATATSALVPKGT